jgi:hypothetical protein
MTLVPAMHGLPWQTPRFTEIRFRQSSEIDFVDRLGMA